MRNYDFGILQYNEFENLTRDLLQAEFGLYIESFKDGKDDGIDLRFGLTADTKCIVQVKRYKNWTSLKKCLEAEKKKVDKLSPTRYVLSTSLPLSPDNKKTIKAIFSPYIKDEADIYGRDDLNNLLGKHTDIERKYYKLWLGSTDVLNEIIHKDIRNWSRLELDTIQEEVRTYVSNDSFNEALKILQYNHYVIISGIPGIGKSTLARMLVYYLLSHNYDEFVCIENDLKDAVALLQKDKKQVFFFDDFLGSNTFEPGEKDFENKLVLFIQAIKRDPSKKFIMTTREYILSQAKEQYEKFRVKNIEAAKCVIDLGAYNKYIRACILYNHLAEAQLTEPYIEQLLYQRNYQKLVNHPYFSPRVIETYINHNQWKTVAPENFVSSFVQMFDSPANVWEYAFDKLSPTTRYALLVLGTMRDTVYERDWREAFMQFCQSTKEEIHLSCSETEWSKNLKILEECFVHFDQTRGKKLIVKLYNPSVLGFIVEYIRKYADVRRQLLSGAKFIEQLYAIFTSKTRYASRGSDAYVFLEPELQQIAHQKMIDMLIDKPVSCYLQSWDMDSRRGFTKIGALLEYSSKHNMEKGLLESMVQQKDFTDRDTDLAARVRISERLDWSIMPYKREEVLRQLAGEVSSFDEAWVMVEALDSIHLDELLEDDTFLNTVNTMVQDEIDAGCDSLEATDATKDIVESIARRLPNYAFPAQHYLRQIETKEEELYAAMPDDEEDWAREAITDTEVTDEMIDEMMTSLRTSGRDSN